jgi:hypothetical protein
MSLRTAEQLAAGLSHVGFVMLTEQLSPFNVLPLYR